MKENNVWLSPKELQQLLQGSLQWNDVEPRVALSKTGIRKLGETVPIKEPVVKQTDRRENHPSLEQNLDSKRLEGKPVIWLLGSVGVLTLSSWFYFVLFSN